MRRAKKRVHQLKAEPATQTSNCEYKETKSSKLLKDRKVIGVFPDRKALRALQDLKDQPGRLAELS